MRFGAKPASVFVRTCLCVLLAIFVICFYKGYFSDHGRWRDKAKPHTDNFLELLTNDRHGELHGKYAGRLNMNDLKREFGRLHNMFGKIESYYYARTSASHDIRSGEITDFYIYYHIKFDQGGGTCQGNFRITAETEANSPEKNLKIKDFQVIGNMEGKKIFILDLSD